MNYELLGDIMTIVGTVILLCLTVGLLGYAWHRIKATEERLRAPDAEEEFERQALRDLGLVPTASERESPALHPVGAPRAESEKSAVETSMEEAAASATEGAVESKPESRSTVPSLDDPHQAAVRLILRLRPDARSEGVVHLAGGLEGELYSWNEGRIRCIVTPSFPSEEVLQSALKRWDAVCVPQPSGDPVVLQRLRDFTLASVKMV